MVNHRDQQSFGSSDVWMAHLISDLFDMFSLTSNGLLAGSISAISHGEGLLSSSLKPSAHLFRCSCSSGAPHRSWLWRVCLYDLYTTHQCSYDGITSFHIALACCFLSLCHEVVYEVPSVISFALKYLTWASASLAPGVLRINISFTFFMASFFFRVFILAQPYILFSLSSQRFVTRLPPCIFHASASADWLLFGSPLT